MPEPLALEKVPPTKVPPNIAEFYQVAGIILSELYREYPVQMRISPRPIAQTLGLANEDALSPSGRNVATIVYHTLGRLSSAGYIDTLGEPSWDGRTCVLSERGTAAMNTPMLGPHTVGEDISQAAKPEVASTPEGQDKLAEVAGTFFGRTVSKVLESPESVVILSLAAESISGSCHVDQGSAHPAYAA